MLPSSGASSRPAAATVRITKQAEPISATLSRLLAGFQALLRAAMRASSVRPGSSAGCRDDPPHQAAKNARPLTSRQAPTPNASAGDDDSAVASAYTSRATPATRPPD